MQLVPHFSGFASEQICARTDTDGTLKPGPVEADPLIKNPGYHGLFRNEKYSFGIQYGPIEAEVQENPGRILDTNFVFHEFRGMKKNVTVVMDEETARWVRVRAAHDDLSVSAFLGAVLKRERERTEGYTQAMERFLSREPRSLAPANTKLPDREELHER